MTFGKVGALAGTHNGVPQLLSKTGEVKALKIIRNPELWNEVYTINGERVDTNRRLIELPFDKEIIDLNIFILPQPKFKVTNTLSFLERHYGIEATYSIEMALQRLSACINVIEA